jgi:hypothetical protein
MLNNTRTKHLIVLFFLALVTLLATSPILSRGDTTLSSQPVSQEQDDGNGNGNGNGRGNGNANGQNGNGNGGGNGNGNSNGNGGGNGNGNGNSNNNAGGSGNSGGQQPPPVSTEPANTGDGLLGCQKNNPERLDCSSLEVSGHCDGTTAVFTIRNTGEPGNGDMRAPTAYRLIVDGVVVQSGLIQLAGGTTFEIVWTGGGNVRLEADQQIGHPGNSHPNSTLNCGEPQVTPTTEIPTEEPTPEPTEEPVPYDLSLEAYCLLDGGAGFHITNIGGAMTTTVNYAVSDEGSNVVDSGQVQLAAGEVKTLEYPGSGILFLTVEGEAVANVGCTPATEEPTPTEEPPSLVLSADCNASGFPTFYITNMGGSMTEPMPYIVLDMGGNVVEEGVLQLAAFESTELAFGFSGTLLLNIGGGLYTAIADCHVTPTEEPTPPPDLNLTADPYCNALGFPAFTVTNLGADMAEPVPYIVYDANGAIVDEGTIQLLSGQSIALEYGFAGTLTLDIGSGLVMATSDCHVTPTEEPTPPPTEEPTPEPTEEPTVEPTEEPTPEPTEEPTLGCQGNHPERLDCSSLQVSGRCEGSVAVFTIRNTGESGNGDMRAPTEYRIYVDGVLVESGQVLLLGGETTEIRYEGGGSVRLEADQQVGHPGKSQPRTTLNCAA